MKKKIKINRNTYLIKTQPSFQQGDPQKQVARTTNRERFENNLQARIERQKLHVQDLFSKEKPLTYCRNHGSLTQTFTRKTPSEYNEQHQDSRHPANHH